MAGDPSSIREGNVDLILWELNLGTTPITRSWLEASLSLNLRFLDLDEALIDRLCSEVHVEPACCRSAWCAESTGTSERWRCRSSSSTPGPICPMRWPICSREPTISTMPPSWRHPCTRPTIKTRLRTLRSRSIPAPNGTTGSVAASDRSGPRSELFSVFPCHQPPARPAGGMPPSACGSIARVAKRNLRRVPHGLVPTECGSHRGTKIATQRWTVRSATTWGRSDIARQVTPRSGLW